MWAKPEINRPEFINNNYDIEGAGPRMLHIGLNKPEFYLSNLDIAGSQPNGTRFVTNRQPSNPLNPSYKLPTFEYVPPEPVAFRRDPLATEDIDGAQPAKRREYMPRVSLSTADIRGARPRVAYYKKTPHNYIDYNDVTRTQWTSSRLTNPLDPRYTLVDESSGHFTKVREMIKANTSYGEIAGAKPAGLPNEVKDRVYGTQDINGAQADTKNAGAFTWMKRRQVRPANKTDDIPGGQADTLRRCVSTTRQSNPLVPDYQVPGAAEGFNVMNDPYGQAASSMGVANYQKAKEVGVEGMV